MRVNILKPGDKIKTVTSDFIVVKRANEEVDLIPIVKTPDGIVVDDSNKITIGFDEGLDESVTEDGVTVINF